MKTKNKAGQNERNELMVFNAENQKRRMEFVDFWSKYVLEHDDKIWSRQQNVIINSCLRHSSMSKEQYLAMKQEGYKVKK